MARFPTGRFAHLATAKTAPVAGRWVWDANAPVQKPILEQMKEAAADSQKSKAPAASRTPKAATVARRPKPQPACRFAHLNAVRPGMLAAEILAAWDNGLGAASPRVGVRGFQNAKRAAAFVLAASKAGTAARPSGGAAADAAAFILAAAATARPNRNGA